ncbi:MAG: aldolase/citrate lyase family protein [Candidatus Latescibacterota bacterium]|nr:aldolase/citrate lyase family protein [Candidatus Latescibacterota bacterium]
MNTIDATDDVFLDNNNAPRRIRAVTVNSASPLLVSLAAEVGFEAVWIESEHGPIGFERAETLCLAAEAGGIFPLIRLPDGERHHILRSLEIGARIILVPMVDDADYARRIVDAGKYPPIGHRGFNTRTRGMGFGMYDLTDILARANARTHLFAQIETTEAVAHIDEILAVDGLSGIFMGPGDLAVSMGRAGQTADPELRETVLTCMAKAKAAGKLTGIFTLPGPLLSAAMQAGCDLVVCGGDVMDLGTAWSKLLGQIPTEGG